MFIFALAIVARALSAWKTVLEGYWFQKHSSAKVVMTEDSDGKLRVVEGPRNLLVWRTSVELPRAFLHLVISGVNYLLYYNIYFWG